jgi:hypothetical protein
MQARTQVTLRLPADVAARLEVAIKAAVKRFEAGINGVIKPTMNAWIVAAVERGLGLPVKDGRVVHRSTKTGGKRASR